MGYLVTAGMALAGGIAGAAGSEENAQVQAQIARNNENTALFNSRIASEEGEQQASIAGLKGQQTVGKIKAGFGGSGVDVNSGSPAAVAAAAAGATSTNVQTIKSNAARNAWGYDVASTNFGNQGVLDEEQGNWQAVTSLLGGATAASGDLAKGWPPSSPGGGSGTTT
jgi:hypothetical protein